MEGQLLGMAASAASGGLFGLAGTVLGRVAGYFERKQEHKHETARWNHDLRLLDAERAAKKEAAELELTGKEIDGSWKGLSASLEAEAAISPSYKWVSAVRGLTRPTLTFLLWFITACIYLRADAAGRDAIIEAMVFAATTATVWWFGDRGPSRLPRRDG